MVGQGGFGKVYLAKDDTNEPKALKMVDLFGLSEDAKNAQIREKDILEKLRQCEQVVTLHDW